jgi:hypothetical protein
VLLVVSGCGDGSDGAVTVVVMIMNYPLFSVVMLMTPIGGNYGGSYDGNG